MKNILRSSRYLLLAVGLLLSAPALWSCNSETSYQKTLREHEDLMKRIDSDTIRNYLVRNNLLDKSVSTNSGLSVVTLTAGTGTPVTAGKQVRVKYVGRLLSNGAQPGSSGYPASAGNYQFPAGTIFENSADKYTDCGCAVFTGGSGLNPGFSEGLLLLRQGDRKVLLVPSRLGYNTVGKAGAVPPDAALMYDVEVLEVF